METPESRTGTAPTLTEQLLLQRAAFLRFLTARIGESAAEDVLQSCYLKVMEKGLRLRDDESIVSWFYTVLRHAMVDHYRRNATRDRIQEQFAAEMPVSYEAELKANLCECLPIVLTTLKSAYQTVLHDIDFEGQSVADFARSHDTTPNNASVRLHRARKAAAKQLTRVCGACAEHKCLDCTCRAVKV